MRSILFKYITREIYSFFFVGLLVFIFIIMATRMIWMTDLLVNQRVNPVQVMKITLCLLPRVIIFSMPAVCLMSVLLTFIRLSSDNEILALNASGVSLYQLLAPVIFFSLISYIIASFISIYWVPWGNRSYRNVILGIAESKVNAVIKERIFYEPFGNDMVFYVNSFSPKDKIMQDLFVMDRRDQPVTVTIVAKKGRIIPSNGSSMLTVNFVDGTIFTNENDFKRARTIKFETYDLKVDLRDAMTSIISKEIEPNEMYIDELINNLKISQEKSMKNNLMEITLFEMFSIPLAIFILGLVGAPLGAHLKVRGYAKGIVLSFFIFLAYYICIMGVRYVCEMSVLPPLIGVWIPVFFLLIVCSYLMIRVANYHPFGFLERLLP